MLTFILISIIFLAAGFIQGLSGFGSALLAMPLLTMFIDVKLAVPLCMLNSLIITSYLSFQLRKYVEKKKVLPLLTGSIPGTFLGVIFLKSMDSDVIKFLLGILIISYSIYSLASRPAPKKLHDAWSYLAGFCTGFIGSAFSAGGPPAIIYTTLTGWSKDHIKATLSGFFFASSLITVTVYALNGLVTVAVMEYFSVAALFVIIGVTLGSRLYDRIDRRAYIRSILVVLIMLGILMTASVF